MAAISLAAAVPSRVSVGSGRHQTRRNRSRLSAAVSAPRLTGARVLCEVKANSQLESSDGAPKPTRRQILATSLTVPAVAPLFWPALSSLVNPEDAMAEPSEASGFKAFENPKECYSLLVPSDWETSQGTVGTRKLVAFHPSTTTQTNVTVLLTPVGADYTSIQSFGTSDAFAEALVNGLDRSYLRKPGQKAQLISAKSARDLYLVDYTIQKPGEDKVHLLSAVGVHFNGIYNQLYTLTAQFMEDDAAAYEPTIRKVVDSFTIIR